MLVLSRKLDEVIRIGHDIKITVIDIRGDKIRLGIDAPPRVEILRQELYAASYPDGNPNPEPQPKD